MTRINIKKKAEYMLKMVIFGHFEFPAALAHFLGIPSLVASLGRAPGGFLCSKIGLFRGKTGFPVQKR